MVSLAASLAASALAQDAGAGRALGAVTQVDAAARRMTLRSDAGETIEVAFGEKASFRRVAPGETNLQNAAAITAADIQPGDRVLVRGSAGADPKSITAALVVVMSKTDIAAKQALERADWDRRGVMGVVTEIAADHVTIQVRSLEGVKPLAIAPAPAAVIRRYAPDSVRFADAKVSSLKEIGKGDQVRARGDKSADGSRMAAEEIVSGSFRMIAGLITSVDGAARIVRITNLETKKPLAVKLTADSSAKRMAPELAQTVADRLHGEPAGRAATGGKGGSEGRGGAGGGRGGDLQQTLERMPAIAVADLKPGEAVIVSSTVGANADEITAISLLAGVEPILRRPGTRELSLGDAGSLAAGADLEGLGFGQ
ncbi:MAG TPA: hypothetical protein VGR73_18315 [Bryobacteraceae bacterium]|nr:hypothetical protein [Bryobacteraceae bacterium]